MANVFHFSYTVGLQDTDAAGIIFFPNIFRMCHIAFEAFVKEIGFPMSELFSRRTMGLPVVHLEADYLKASRVGDALEVRVHVAHIGKSSIRLEYEFLNAAHERCAAAAVVHVCVDPKTFHSIEIPADFRTALERFA